MDKLDLDEVPFRQIEKLGITREMLEQTGNLEKLLKGEKTDLIRDFKIVQQGVEKTFSAHLVLERNPSGKLQFKIRAPEMKEVIQLAKKEDISIEKIPFKQVAIFGISKKGLQESGNLEKLLKGEKTDIIHNITFIIEGKEKRASGRLFLIITPAGALKFQIDFVKTAEALLHSAEDEAGGKTTTSA